MASIGRPILASSIAFSFVLAVGNTFFRSISTISALGYVYRAYTTYNDKSRERGDWRVFAVAAVLGAVTIVHSAVNMQPINDKLSALANGREKGGVGLANAEDLARKWGKFNLLRLVNPTLSGLLALS